MTIDEELRMAADDLRRDLRTANPPPLDRAANQRPAASGAQFVLVMASLAILVIGGFVVVTGNEPDETEASVSDDADTPVADESEPSTAGGGEIDTSGWAERTFIDATTGNRLVSVETQDLPGSAVLPIPAGAPAWNADGSLLLLYEVGVEDGGHALYDGRSLNRIRSLDIAPVDIEQAWWDPTEPSRLYYVLTNELVAHDVITDQVVMVHRFDGCDVVDGVRIPRAISNDGKWFGSLCKRADGTDLVAVDLSTGTEVRRATEPDTVGPVPLVNGSGFVTSSPTGTVVVYNNNLEPTGVSFAVGTDQFALIETVDNRQLYVTAVFEEPEEAIGSVVGFDLSSGQPVAAIGEAVGDPYPPTGTRLSASVAGSGQVAVSIVGTASAIGPTSLDGKVFLVDFNTAEPTVTQIADHLAGIELAEVNPYWTVPHPGMHPDGETVAFAGGLIEGQITTFVAGPAVEDTP